MVGDAQRVAASRGRVMVLPDGRFGSFADLGARPSQVRSSPNNRHEATTAACFGGSCFPKDIRALAKTGQDHGAPLRIVEAVLTVNDSLADLSGNPGLLTSVRALSALSRMEDHASQQEAILGAAAGLPEG